MDTVYQPAEDSFMMEEVLSSVLGSQSTVNGKPLTVLDMGTGSGIQAIAAAKKGCSVTAVDINPEAIKFAKENAQKQRARVNFIHSDLFKNVKGKFDLIIFNPPYLRTEDPEPVDMQSIAWHGGKTGLKTVNRFLSTVRSFLKPGGRILLLVSSIDEKPPTFQGFEQKILKKKSFFFERLFVLELKF